MQDNINNLLENIKKSIINNVLIKNSEKFINSSYQKEDYINNKMGVWLFSYNEITDILEYWKILPPNDLSDDNNKEYENAVKDTVIKGGSGTIGYIVRSAKPELVNNTFDDPRGTVSIEDSIIHNYSWMGVPIGIKRGNKFQIVCVISFFYPNFNFWNEKKKDKILEDVDKCIEENYSELLVQYNKNLKKDKLLDIFQKDPTSNDFRDILPEIGSVIKNSFPFESILLNSVSDNDNIKIEHLYFNTKIIEDRIKNILNWCSISYNKCDVRLCPLKKIFSNDSKFENEYLNDSQEKCIFLNDFLYKILPIYIKIITIKKGNIKYSIVLYLNKDIDVSSLKEDIEKKICDIILPYINIYENLNKNCNKDYQSIKVISETISLVLNDLSALFLMNDKEEKKLVYYIENIIKKLKFTNKSKILENKFQKFDEKNIEKKLNKLVKLINEHNKKLKYNIVMIQIWENNANKIQIKSIKTKSSKIKEKTLDTFALNLFQHSNISVIKRSILDENFNYKFYPLLWIVDKNLEQFPKISIDKTKKIYKLVSSTGENFTINWDNKTSPYLHYVKINHNIFIKQIRKNLNKFFIDKFSIDNYDNYKVKNYFFNFELHLLYPNVDHKNKLMQNKFKYFISIGVPYSLKNRKEEEKRISDFTRNLYNYTKSQIEIKTRQKEAFKSAVAAIMSRNMSHNIGSHILSRLSSIYSNEDEIDKLIKKKQFSPNIKLEKSDAEKFDVLNNKTGEIITHVVSKLDINRDKRQKILDYLKSIDKYNIYKIIDESKVFSEFYAIAHFFRYLQNRQDYIATITGSGKDIPIMQNFLNDILNVLLAEKITGYTEFKNLLLEYIVLSEKIKGNMIDIYFNDCNCVYEKNKNDSINIAQNLDIALPSGKLGSHAFFSIFENFIRNSAKHSGQRLKKKDKLKIFIGTPDLLWNDKNKRIENNYFAGKVFWVEQVNSKEPIRKGPYYIVKNKNGCFMFFCEIPFHIKMNYDNKKAIFDLNGIKDFKNFNNKELILDGPVIKNKQGNETLKFSKQNDSLYTIIIKDEKNEELRSYPIHLINDNYSNKKAYIFITNQYVLKKNGNNWILENQKIPKNYESEQWSKRIDLSDIKNSLEINNHFILTFDEDYYDPDSLVRFTFTDNLGNYHKFYEDIEKGLKEKIIDSDGRLIESNKGLKEMWISACWLRGEDFTIKKSYALPILSCVCSNTQSKCFNCMLKNKNEHGSLQYIFFIKKAKEVLFILDEGISIEDIKHKNNDLEVLNSKGIEFKKYEEFINSENLHKYFVFVTDNDFNEKFKNLIDKYKYNRGINISKDELIKIINNKPKVVITKVINKWIEKKWGKKNNIVYIIDDLEKIKDKNSLSKKSSLHIFNRNKINLIEIGQNVKIEKNDNNLIYLWMKHFEDSKAITSIEEKNEKILKNSDYIEGITGNNKTSWLIRDFTPKDDCWLLSLIEAAKCKILVIDERIWEENSKVDIDSENLKNENKNVKLIFEKKNIEIWDLYITDNNEKIIKFVNLVGEENTLEDLMRNAKIEYDIITVHQGIIDKIVSNSKYEKSSLENLFINLGCKIITHSGRSRPDSDKMLFGSKGNFISFTSLYSALKDSKYHLVNLLYSIRGG